MKKLGRFLTDLGDFEFAVLFVLVVVSVVALGVAFPYVGYGMIVGVVGSWITSLALRFWEA